jgi:hypothetical protein
MMRSLIRQNPFPNRLFVRIVSCKLFVVVWIILQCMRGKSLAKDRTVWSPKTALNLRRCIKHSSSQQSSNTKRNRSIALPVRSRVIPPTAGRRPHILWILEEMVSKTTFYSYLNKQNKAKETKK